MTLVDAGFPGKEAAVFEAIRDLGRSSDQLKHLIFTHHHLDHIGSAAAIVGKTGARTYIHPLDIPMAQSGGPFRPMCPAPGLLRKVMCRLFYDHNERVAPVVIDQPLTDGEILPIAGGIEIIHVPGHCAGQVALLWPSRTYAVRGRCLHESHGPWRSCRLRKLGGWSREPTQTCQSIIRCSRVRPRQAHRQRCVDAFPK